VEKTGGVLAPAKLTLTLRVTGVRADGYHLIDAEIVSVDLCDTLTFADGDGLTITGLDVPDDGDNLVTRALHAVGRRAHVTLHKEIPAGAGLGGGSSDAAAVLRWAGVEDLALAASIGGDVPFCLVGGRARVTGIGDVLAPLPFIEGTFTLLTPPLHVSTPAVYAKWDELGGPHADEARRAARRRSERPRTRGAGRVPRSRALPRPTRRRHGPDPGARRQRVDVVRGGRVSRRRQGGQFA
jgi:4-diphosphocytidyl-2C-methyl-D-erythritol kinase